MRNGTILTLHIIPNRKLHTAIVVCFTQLKPFLASIENPFGNGLTLYHVTMANYPSYVYT